MAQRCFDKPISVVYKHDEIIVEIHAITVDYYCKYVGLELTSRCHRH
jgi:hypothetical protein